MPHRELKQRVSESRAKRVWTLPNRWSSESHQACLNGRVATEVGVANVSCFDQRSNIVLGQAKRQSRAKREQRMTDFLGHSNNFATLSLSLSQVLTASPPHLIIYAPVRVNIRLSMQKAMGSRYVFMPCRLLKRPFLQRKYY